VTLKISDFLKKRSFYQYLLILIFLLVIAIVTGITVMDYISEQAEFEQNSNSIQSLTEEDLKESLQLVDSGFKLYDNTLNRQMRGNFKVFLEEYNRSGMDPEKMDLEMVKQELGENIDLYIINESGVIQYSTYKPEIGLDFSTIPYFFNYLNRIRLSEGFFPDRVVREAATGKLRKFAYQPTPDHRYVLELGLTGEELLKERGTLQYRDVINRIASHNPYIENIRIFNSKGQPIGDYTGVPDPEDTVLFQKILENRKDIKNVNASTGYTLKYLFIDLKDPDYGSDTSLVVELTYNNQLIQDALNQLLLTKLLFAFAALLTGLAVALLISNYLNRPIREIVEDVDRVAQGELDHKIRTPRGREFQRLEQSINAMVFTLKETISRQTEIESELRMSEERYKMTSDLISDYAYAMRVEPSGRFVAEWATGAYRSIIGISKEEILKSGGWSTFIYPEDQGILDEHRRKLFANESYVSEFRVVNKNGEIHWVNHRTQPEWDEIEGRLVRFYAAGQDITGRKRVEEELRQLNEELEARVSSRTTQLETINKELESFSYMVSHDLRAPLRAIDGFSRIVLDEYTGELPDEGKRYLSLVRDNVSQMRDLIDNLINFSHMGRKSLNIVTVHPSDIVREALDDLRNEQAGRALDILIEDLPSCRADPDMLKLVYSNLISNALKFTRQCQKARIEIGSFKKYGQNVYFVRDNGIGFDMRYSPKLFVVFQRLHPVKEYEGTGLGLAIVQRIIHRHGGDVWADAEIDQGATFFFTIDGGTGEKERDPGSPV